MILKKLLQFQIYLSIYQRFKNWIGPPNDGLLGSVLSYKSFSYWTSHKLSELTVGPVNWTVEDPFFSIQNNPFAHLPLSLQRPPLLIHQKDDADN